MGKGGRCVRLTTLPPSCAVVMTSGSLNFLEPSGPLQACNGAALPFSFLLNFIIFNTHGILFTFIRHKVKLSLACHDSSTRASPIFLNLATRRMWVVCFKPQPFQALEERSRNPVNTRLGRCHNRKENLLPLPVI